VRKAIVGFGGVVWGKGIRKKKKKNYVIEGWEGGSCGRG
jgi:hypothetical protein